MLKATDSRGGTAKKKKIENRKGKMLEVFSSPTGTSF